MLCENSNDPMRLIRVNLGKLTPNLLNEFITDLSPGTLRHYRIKT
jgi:hypothetical protein